MIRISTSLPPHTRKRRSNTRYYRIGWNDSNSLSNTNQLYLFVENRNRIFDMPFCMSFVNPIGSEFSLANQLQSLICKSRFTMKEESSTPIPHKMKDYIICHRCGKQVRPIGEERLLVRNGITTCRECLLFLEKNGRRSISPSHTALSPSLRLDPRPRLRGCECVPHAMWKVVRRPVGRPRLQPIIAVFVRHNSTLSLLRHLQAKPL